MPAIPLIEQLRSLLTAFVAEYPETQQTPDFWRSPLLVSARADERFEALSRIASPKHMLPTDLLASAQTVIVFFVPFKAELAEENHPGKFPCRNWGLAYQTTNPLIESASERLRTLLEEQGHTCALTPATHNFDEETLMARWSHKHLGYLAGLGRFGINAQLISPVGCAGRYGSLVTSAKLGDHPLVTEPELCLYKTAGTCLECVNRCPVKAVQIETGIDRRRCWKRLHFNLDHSANLAGMEPSTHVCGKCQVNLPCSLGVPQAPAG